jgi:hypothetical protein
VCPLQQSQDLLSSIIDITMGLRSSGQKVGCLLSGRHELRHPLLGDNKLCGQLSPQPCLLNEAVLDVLLLPEDPGFPLTTRHEGLQEGDKLETTKHKMKIRSMNVSHLAN